MSAARRIAIGIRNDSSCMVGFVVAQEKKNRSSDYQFRSDDLWVMGPTRFLCAKSLWEKKI